MSDEKNVRDTADDQHEEDVAHCTCPYPDCVAHGDTAVEVRLAPVSASAQPVSVREAARRRQPLGGADVQALEHALTITEQERDKARDELRRASACPHCGKVPT